ncbi:ABC transporter substrate-binding protein [Paenibacillus sp. tmac-D7]|uniref:ABC transporter substrate-binding protein n=1 Tax=Paenibacillus sp. tmac-D7 TaxID=2591462 RepID=UPI0011451417|nr:ABC transporter substrate-binding protein [Paenibacillus sp. tmac-D7]
MLFRKQTIGSTILMICALFLLAACGSNDGKSTSVNESHKQAGAELKVTDAMGEVTVPADAKRILAPHLEDSLIALGVKPAAQWSIGATVLDYLQTDLKGVPTIGWDLPIEQTIGADPDLIIFSSASAIQNGQYESYKKIAPTYIYKDADSADWRKQLQIMGQLLGKDKEAADKLASYDAKAKQAKEKIKAAIGDQTAAILWVIGDQYYLFENNRFAANVLFGDLAVAQPKMIQQLPAAENTWKPIALEALADLDADHLFLASKPEEAGLDKLKQSAIYKGLKAVKGGHVYEMADPSPWTISGLIANEITMDHIVKALVK